MIHIELVFGHTCANGLPLPSEQIAQGEEIALRVFAQLFRGGRLTPQTGSYQTAKGLVMIEGCSVVWCNARSVNDGELEQLFRVGQELCSNLQQESVILTVSHVNGEQYWIGPAA